MILKNRQQNDAYYVVAPYDIYGHRKSVKSGIITNVDNDTHFQELCDTYRNNVATVINENFKNVNIRYLNLCSLIVETNE